MLLDTLLAANEDVESNRLAAKTAMAKRLDGLAFGSVSDFFEGRKVAFACRSRLSFAGLGQTLLSSSSDKMTGRFAWPGSCQCFMPAGLSV